MPSRAVIMNETQPGARGRGSLSSLWSAKRAAIKHGSASQAHTVLPLPDFCCLSLQWLPATPPKAPNKVWSSTELSGWLS